MVKNQVARLLQRTFSATKLCVTGTGWRTMTLHSGVAKYSSLNSNGFDLTITRVYGQVMSGNLDHLQLSYLCRSELGWIFRSTAHRTVIRLESTAATPLKEGDRPLDQKKPKSFKQENSESQGDEALSHYWGVAGKKGVREDGTSWPWNCFKPAEIHISDVSIDLSKHHKPELLIDKVAFWTVKLLRIPTDIFFQKRYGCRAMMLETVAAVPGMVGGMLLHLKSLRRFEHSGGWIKALLEEAENERMHLMTFMEVAKPAWYERALVITVQGIFFNAYFLLYVLSPRLAHRIVGYLEEEAIYSYTEYLKEIDNGHLPNLPAPAIAIDYWGLPKNALIRDVVVVVRADEAHHRDVNHFAADIKQQGKELREAAAPVGYH